MKTLSFFKFLLLGILISSCSSGDEDTGSGNGNGNGNADVTSITLYTESNEVNTGSQVTFVVTGNNDSDLTNSSSLKVDGQSVSNPCLFNIEGTYQVVASYSDLTSNTITISVSDAPASSIILSFNQESYLNGDSATYTVKDNLNNTVTSEAEVTVNGTVIDNPYNFTTDGTYDFVATYEGFTSNTVSFTIETPSVYSDTSSFDTSGAPTTFTKKVLLEDFTGTWCPQCPPAGAAILSAMNSNSNVFGVGYHDGDPMQISETSFWSNYYNVTGFPTVYVNGADTRWNFPNMGQVNSELAETATVGLAIEGTIIGEKLDLEVKVGFNTTPNEEIKLMIYLIEDNVTTSTPQSGSSQGASYVHRDVLREVYTGQLGDVITSSNTINGGVFTRTITGLDLPSNVDNFNNLKLIAFVRNTYTKTFVDFFGDTHTNSPHYDIYNVQEVHVGESQAFD